MKRTTHKALIATLVLTALSTAWGGSCPTDLGHIAGKMPAYNDPDLKRLRTMVLGTDLNRALADARRMGYSPRSAASATLEQARVAERSLKSAESCIRQASSDPSAVIRQLQNGTFRFGSGSISDSCAKGYVLSFYQAVANRESATALACLANQ